MTSDSEKLLPILIERSGAINTYWNLFIGVALGCLGLFASAKPFTASSRFKALVTLAFAWFAWSNLDAILALNRMRNAIADLITEESLRRIVSELRPYSTSSYIVYHLVLDLSVVFTLWFVKWPEMIGKPVVKNGETKRTK